MTVLEMSGEQPEGAKEPIQFPGTKEEKRQELLQRRAEAELRKAELERRRANARASRSPTLVPVPDPDPDDVVRPVEREGNIRFTDADDADSSKVSLPALRRRRISWTFLSFLLMVAIPGALGSLYFMVFASPQYVVETQFSVRGSNQASIASFGLSGLFGTSVQSGDSYIVQSYIGSVQLLRDVKEQLGIDLRQYYSKNDIDFHYRINPNMPFEQFADYWRNMIEVSFNSTTGNTTLYVFAFSPDDSKAIADAVLKVSERLVNDLSEKSRQQMTLIASKQVERSEERLRKVRDEVRRLRAQEKTIDPQILVKSDAELSHQLENQIQQLKTRRAALLQSVSEDSPSARMMQKQIHAAEEQLAFQQGKIGTVELNKDSKPNSYDSDRNIAEVVDKFEGLNIEQEFATKAYTTSLAAFEASLSEAQKQERYFATFIAPARPEVALYPQRLLDTFIMFLVLGAVWMISQFLYRSFRDHAI